MKGDFTRFTFDIRKHYSSVLMQQGRVQLDSDHKEQIDIEKHLDLTIHRDVIGHCGVPKTGGGFKIEPDGTGNLTISAGRMYVQGILCENEENITYNSQPDLPDQIVPDEDGIYLAYIDVWQRHITALEDHEIREVALGGPDTATRTKTVWQVKLAKVGDSGDSAQCDQFGSKWHPEGVSDGKLRARVEPGAASEDPCIIPPQAGYRRLENQLYRVEVHKSGSADDDATFKWSRDNGTVVVRLESITDTTMVVSSHGKDAVLGFAPGQWVELSDESLVLKGEPGVLVQLASVTGNELKVVAWPGGNQPVLGEKPSVRRWDSEGEISIATGNYIALEDGVEVQFESGKYNSGDYWLIPARTVTGNIEWPIDETTNEPIYNIRHGINHYYCPLAIATKTGNNIVTTDCRSEFPPLTELPKEVGKGCCTVTVGADGDFDDIQLAVNALNGGPGTVCILPGIYEIETPIIVNGRDITIKGCQSSSIILNLGKISDSVVFYIQNSQGINISNLWCVSVGDGGRAIVSETSNFININNCVVIAAGIDDLAGAITFQGNSFNTKISDCLISGRIGVRYKSLVRNTAIHFSSRIEQCNIIALQSAISQSSSAFLMGMIVEDNLLLGYSLSLISKAYIPQTFFNFAKNNKLFSRNELNKARTARNKGNSFEKTSGSNFTPLLQFANNLRADVQAARLNVKSLSAVQFPTYLPVIDLQQSAMDVNIINNFIIGKIGINAVLFLESVIEKNWISTTETAIVTGSLQDVIVDGNFLNSVVNGLICTGPRATTLTVNNNHFICGKIAIGFADPKDNVTQLVANIQISQNYISALSGGINLNNPAIIVYDFTAVDNSIISCQKSGITLAGFDENKEFGKDVSNFQRVIQRNSIKVKNTGIIIGIPDTKIVNNDITIEFESDNRPNRSNGIIVRSDNCIITNNSILGIHDSHTKIYSKGGILIQAKTLSKNIIIKGNQIIGGVGNGIEISSNTHVLCIENNLITDMGLNGISVDEYTRYTNYLTIINNKILRCNQIAASSETWWKFAGIVLTRGENIQITGNEICENGNEIDNPDFLTGGIYAEQIRDTVISNNQFVDNGNKSDNFSSSQAIIHLRLIPIKKTGNENIKIVGNLVRGSRAPSLFLDCQWFLYPFGYVRYGTKNVITSNNFESLIEGPAVELQSNKSIFSNNYVECEENPDQNSVDLGVSQFVTVIGNVINAPITGVGPNQVIDHNIIY